MKFEGGLRDEIQLQVSSAGTRDFVELVEQCQRVDECCRRMAVARNVRSNMPPWNFGHRLAPQGRNQPLHNFSQGGRSQNRPNSGGNGSHHPGNAPRLTSGQSGRQCPRCKGYHGNEPCRAGGNICYNCGRPGHYARDCHAAPSGSGESSQRQPPAGRVYALTVGLSYEAKGGEILEENLEPFLVRLVSVAKCPVVISVKYKIRRSYRIIARRYNTSLDLSRPIDLKRKAKNALKTFYDTF
ncbi:hypothetical protein PIB30_001574 [Stylosanthes scabra]|uniref:CCHC-type domain-containing protein n=1 Tax=Stylosanthes scabra TaxID=79078 RepID=A0ABU6R3H3_9FABA|nr:hypothetical protein [Stylosanthes scabra]